MRSNFVLKRDPNFKHFYVIKKRGLKVDYSNSESFIGFFETPEKAYNKAIEILNTEIGFKMNDIKNLKDRKRRNLVYC